MSKCTVVVPVYKVDLEYLKKCLNSLLQQTLHDIEILIVLDGAPDNSYNLCKKYAEKDKRVQIIRQKNQGVAVARNEGIKRASSPYITFVDADDWVEPEFCETFYQLFKEKQDVQIVSVAAYINKADEEIRNPFWDESEKYFIGKEKEELQLQSIYSASSAFVPRFSTFGWTWAKAYDRNWIISEQLCYPKGFSRGEDTIFNLYAVEKASKIYYKEKYLYHYRKNQDSAINKYTAHAIDSYENLLKAMEKFIKETHKDKRFVQAFYKKNILLLSLAINCDQAHKDNPQSYWKKRTELKKILNNPKYKLIFKELNLRDVPIKRRAHWLLIKYKMVDLILLAHIWF